MQTPNQLNESSLSLSYAKSIFASRTFWAAVFTAIAAIAPIVGKAVENRKFTVDATVNIVIILCGAGGTVVGRVQAKDSIYTPNGLPGPDRADFPQKTNS